MRLYFFNHKPSMKGQANKLHKANEWLFVLKNFCYFYNFFTVQKLTM